jgi:SAM-dependent methyltransferase
MTPAWDFPPEFDPGFYRAMVPDLAGATDAQLLAHYETTGRDFGVPGNRLTDRGEFASLVTAANSVLEIGPFAAPLLRGTPVRYCDVLDTAQLRERAASLGMDPALVPEVHYRMGDGLLDDVPDRFEAILGSHSIEHQPDLVGHLQQVERRLLPGGRYFLLVPDHRYTFDRQIPASTIAEVLQAHEEGRRVHTLRSVIEHRALTVHNDPVAHWESPLPAARPTPPDAEAVTRAVEEFHDADGGYIDVHAWYFTPDSFAGIVGVLHRMGLIGLEIDRLYPPRRFTPEFWAILRPAVAEPQAAGGAGSFLGRVLRGLRGA